MDEEDEVEEVAPVVVEPDLEVEDISPVEEKALAPPKYEVRPGLGEKFQAANVRDIILTTMQEQLMGRQYRSDQAPRWAKVIANGIRQRVQELDMKRCKNPFVISALGQWIGEFGVHAQLLNMHGARVVDYGLLSSENRRPVPQRERYE